MQAQKLLCGYFMMIDITHCQNLCQVFICVFLISATSSSFINISIFLLGLNILRKRVKHESCIHPLFKVVGTFNQQPKLIFVAIATSGRSVKILQLVSII